MTYSDWREPVRLLELSTGLASDAQRAFAEQVGLVLDGTEPHDVVGVMLEEHLRPVIWAAEPDPASDRQRSFLEALGAAPAAELLSKQVASAWIEHYLALRSIANLRALALARDDAVIKHTHWRHPQTGVPHESLNYYIVSSIRADGLVYFKGGNGKCGWPSSLERPEPGDAPDRYPQFKTQR